MWHAAAYPSVRNRPTQPVLLLNIGSTLADGIPGLEKAEVQSGDIIPDVVRAVV